MPTPNMTDEDRKMLSDVHLAVCGSKELRIKGLGERVDKVEERQDEVEKTITKWGALATGISTTASVLSGFILRGHK